MPTPFPQELTDTILNELRNDIPTLNSCPLVSRAFVPTSRAHLFSRVRLTPPTKAQGNAPNRCQRFYQIIQSSPHIVSHVKHLELVEGHRPSKWHDTDEVSWLVSCRPLPLLLLDSLNTISLGCTANTLIWNRVSPILKSSLRNVFVLPRLTGIRLYNVGFDGWSDLYPLFANSPSLEHLSLLNVSTWEDPFDAPITYRPQLLELSISDQWSAAFMCRIQCPWPSIHVRSQLCTETLCF